MKYCGKERGSITLFLALILSLLLSLVCTSIESVCMASARTQILNSMDIGLYSVFGQYDRKLLEEYDLFALDGSMGGGQLNLAKICDNLESYMKPVLKQNSQKLELHQSGLTGYRLLTDECGEVFYQQRHIPKAAFRVFQGGGRRVVCSADLGQPAFQALVAVDLVFCDEV